jgi:hypothetical protein
MKYLKNVLFVLLPVVIVLTFFGVSFIIGEKIFFAYQTTGKDSLQKSVAQNSKEMPDVAVVPKADGPEATVPSVKPDANGSPLSQAAGLGDATLRSYMESLQVKARENPAPAHPKGVRVIGNSDSKRYHLPGMKYYDSVKAYHRVVFQSEKEAIQAGYNRARE